MHLELDIARLYLKPLLIGELAPEEPSQERNKNVSDVSGLKNMWRDGAKVYFRFNLSFSLSTQPSCLGGPVVVWVSGCHIISKQCSPPTQNSETSVKQRNRIFGPMPRSNSMSLNTYSCQVIYTYNFCQWLLVIISLMPMSMLPDTLCSMREEIVSTWLIPMSSGLIWAGSVI